MTENGICGLLIASGYSARMNKLKALMELGGVSFITGITIKLSLVCDKVIVVLGHQGELIEKSLREELTRLSQSSETPLGEVTSIAAEKIETLYNENYDKGMFTSLQAGIKRAMDYPWVFYHFVDQPALPIQFYFEMTKNLNKTSSFIQPEYNGRRGHPILLSGSLYESIIGEDAESNLRNVLLPVKEKRQLFNCSYPEVLDDIDTVEDYSRLQERGYNFLKDFGSTG